MDELLAAQLEKITFPFERFIKERLGIDIDGSQSGETCRFFLRGGCPRGAACPQKHSVATPNPLTGRVFEKTIVCKHWLRGLCKKGDSCEFLHEYDLKRMPECWFFIKYGECNNPDCLYLHVDPKSKHARHCLWYARGFCKHGPACRNRHVRNTACPLYISGFCPFGPDCQLGHPKFELPPPYNTITNQSFQPMLTLDH